jgi:hypothetical protein
MERRTTMRVIIDIVDTAAGAPASVEVREPEGETFSPAGASDIAAAGTFGIQRYDGGADVGAPPPAGRLTEVGTPAQAALRPGTARDGGAAPDAAEAAIGPRIPIQIEASGGLNGGSPAY